MSEYQQNDILYLAGLLDGEGSITAGASHNYQPMLSMSLYGKVSTVCLSWLKASFKGNVNPVPSGTNLKGYQWAITKTSNLEPLLRELYPHLKIKQRQAGVALRLCELMKPHEKSSDEDNLMRMALGELMYKLNHAKE